MRNSAKKLQFNAIVEEYIHNMFPIVCKQLFPLAIFVFFLYLHSIGLSQDTDPRHFLYQIEKKSEEKKDKEITYKTLRAFPITPPCPQVKPKGGWYSVNGNSRIYELEENYTDAADTARHSRNSIIFNEHMNCSIFDGCISGPSLYVCYDEGDAPQVSA